MVEMSELRFELEKMKGFKEKFLVCKRRKGGVNQGKSTSVAAAVVSKPTDKKEKPNITSSKTEIQRHQKLDSSLDYRKTTSNDVTSYSKTVTTYLNHVWLIQVEGWDKIAIFWLKRKNCNDWYLSIQADLSVQYGTKACMFRNDDFHLELGEYYVNKVIETGRKTVKGDMSEKIKLKFINESGRKLKLFWIDYEGRMIDYSS